MVGVSLLIDVNEASLRLSASRGVNALTRDVIPQVVDTRDTLELGSLLAGLRVQDSQHRRVARATEKPMMRLIERQRHTGLNPSHGPGCNLFVFFRIYYSKISSSGKRHENSRARFFNLDATRPGIGLDIANMFLCARVDHRQSTGFGIAESDVKD